MLYTESGALPVERATGCLRPQVHVHESTARSSVCEGKDSTIMVDRNYTRLKAGHRCMLIGSYGCPLQVETTYEY